MHTAPSLQVAMQPNPVTEEVTINFTAAQKNTVMIRMMNTSGVNIYNRDLGVLQNGKISVPLSGFASGIYMVELTGGDQKTVLRLLKE